MDEESLSDMESVFREMVLETRKNTQRNKDESDRQAAALIRQIRNRYGPMVYVAIDALVPLCLGCKQTECRWLETQLPQPSVSSEGWRRDYLEMGIPRKKVREASQSLNNGTWPGPECYQCGSVIELDVRGGEGFYLKTVSISEIFNLKRGVGRKAPAWMQKIVLEAYERKCSGCGITLTNEQATIDHIIPVSEGGETEMDNLQPMCQRCNQEKKNRPVNQVDHPSLQFSLLPLSENMLD